MDFGNSPKIELLDSNCPAYPVWLSKSDPSSLAVWHCGTEDSPSAFQTERRQKINVEFEVSWSRSRIYHQNPEGPPVGSRFVTFPIHHLWRHILNRSTKTISFRAIKRLFRQSEIGQGYVTILQGKSSSESLQAFRHSPASNPPDPKGYSRVSNHDK